jgi:hypothetical protein
MVQGVVCSTPSGLQSNKVLLSPDLISAVSLLLMLLHLLEAVMISIKLLLPPFFNSQIFDKLFSFPILFLNRCEVLASHIILLERRSVISLNPLLHLELPKLLVFLLDPV